MLSMKSHPVTDIFYKLQKAGRHVALSLLIGWSWRHVSSYHRHSQSTPSHSTTESKPFSLRQQRLDTSQGIYNEMHFIVDSMKRNYQIALDWCTLEHHKHRLQEGWGYRQVEAWWHHSAAHHIVGTQTRSWPAAFWMFNQRSLTHSCPITAPQSEEPDSKGREISRKVMFFNV